MLRRFAGLLATIAALVIVTPAHAGITATSASITWTAPGDDSLSGTASSYDLRLSTSPITANNFANATRVTIPAPHASGIAEVYELTGLSPNTHYYVAIKTADERPNWSGISNVLDFITPASSDTIRPAAAVIAAGALTDVSVQLTWNATGDDSLSGTAASYDVRWSTQAITENNWASATVVTSGVPAPAAPGTAQSVTIGGLNRSVDLYFAIKVRDGVGQYSALSNVISVQHVLDTAPPATPSGLAASMQSDGVHLHWNANAEADLNGYHVYRAVSASGPWDQLDASTLATNDYLDASAPDSASLWYQVSAYDVTGNVSARSGAYRLYTKAQGITAVKMQPAYPNPSRSSDPVTVPVEVPAAGPFTGKLVILDSAGERVRTIELSNLAPGVSPIAWDGHNDSGRAVAPGVYRAWLTLGGTTQVVKLVRQP